MKRKFIHSFLIMVMLTVLFGGFFSISSMATWDPEIIDLDDKQQTTLISNVNYVISSNVITINGTTSAGITTPDYIVIEDLTSKLTSGKTYHFRINASSSTSQALHIQIGDDWEDYFINYTTSGFETLITYETGMTVDLKILKGNPVNIPGSWSTTTFTNKTLEVIITETNHIGEETNIFTIPEVSATANNITYTADGNLVTLNTSSPATSGFQSHIYTNFVNLNDMESGQKYMLKYTYVSGSAGTTNGVNVGLSESSATMSYLSITSENYEETRYKIFTYNGGSVYYRFVASNNGVGATYSDLNFTLDIFEYEEGESIPPDVGESTDPPDGIYLSGSHVGFPGTIYFNRAEEHDTSTHQAWYLATGSGSTFDLEALAVEQINMVFEPDSKILVVGTELSPGDITYTIQAWYTNTDIVLDIYNPSSYDTIRVRSLIDDEVQDDENMQVELFDYILLMTPLFLGDELPNDIDIIMDYEGDVTWLYIIDDEKVYFTNNETIDIEIIDDNLDFHGTQISSSNEEYSHLVLVINDEEFIFNISGDPVHFEIYQGGENGHVIDVDGVPHLDNEELSSLQIYLTTFETEVYRVDFFDDETLLDNINVFENDLIPEPENPTKEGFVFHQWETLDDVVWNFDVDVVTEYTTLFAKWIEVGIDEIVVIFNSNGGSSVSFQVITSGEKVTEPTNPTKEDFTFDGWFVNIGLTTPFDFDDEVSLDFTLYAKWIPVEIETPPIDVGSIVTEYGVFIIIGLVIIIALFGFISKRK